MSSPAPTIPKLSSPWEVYPALAVGSDGRTYASLRTGAGLKAVPALVIPAGWESYSPVSFNVPSTRYTAAIRTVLPTPTPPVTPVKPPVTTTANSPAASLPAIARLVCPNPLDPGKPFAGIEVNGGGSVTWQNQHIEGFSQNLIAENLSGDLVLNNVRTCRAWRRTPTEVYDGNGLYVQKIRGKITATGFFARGNGWQLGQAPKEISQYRHNWYADFGVSGGITITTGIFADASGSLFEGRNHFVINNGVFLNGATAVAAIQAGFELHDCTLYDGHYSAALGLDATGQYVVKGWTAHTALAYCCDGTLTNTWIVARPNQGAAMAALAPAPTYPQGCLVGTKVWGGMGPAHPDYVPQATPPRLNASGCVIAGAWPGKVFDGDSPHSGAGFAVKATTGADFDPTAVLDQVEANTLSIADAVTSLTNSIRGLVVS